jgi:hypothetical protein
MQRAGHRPRATERGHARLLALAFTLATTVLFAAPPAGATDHSGTLPGNETWAAADNPHVVTGTVTVPAGVTLTIEDGAEVLFGSNDRINVYGVLVATGTAGQGIQFLPFGANDWFGLRFLGDGSGSISHATFERASTAVDGAGTGSIDVADCTLTDGNYGLRISQGTVDLTSVAISGMQTAGLRSTGVTPAFLDAASVIEDCAVGVELLDIPGLVFTPTLTIRGTTEAGLALDDCPGALIDNVTLESCTGTAGAILVENNGEFTLGAGNAIGGPGVACSWPLTIDAEAFPTPGSTIPTSGNTSDAIQVRGGNSDRAGTWPRFAGLDYVVTSATSVGASGELTIADGVTVRFQSNDRINVYGTLQAPGTAGQGIAFVPDGAENWFGLRFFATGGGSFSHVTFELADVALDLAGTGTLSLDHCTITDGSYGIRASDGALELTTVSITGMSSAGLRVSNVAPTLLDASSVIEDCDIGVELIGVPDLVFTTPLTIRGAAEAGLVLDDCPGALVDNVTLESCTGPNGAILVEDNGPFTLGGGNAIGGLGVECSWPLTIDSEAFPAASSTIPATGNARDAIQVRGGNSDRSGVWPAFAGLDYVVTAATNVGAGGALTVADGVTVRFDQNDRINVYGTLDAPGTAGQGIEFLADGSDRWYGLRFFNSASGSFSHCLFDHASTALDMLSTGTLAIEHCTITDGTYGVRASDGTVELTSLAVSAMSDAGLRFDGVAPDLLDAGTVIENCDVGVEVRGVPGLAFGSPLTIRATADAGLALDDCPGAIIDDVTLENCAGLHGAILVENNGEFTLGGGNVIGGAGGACSWPLTIDTETFPTAASVIPTSGNLFDAIQVRGGNSDRAGVWPAFAGLDYVVTIGAAIGADGALTIADGVTVRFENNDRLNVYGDLQAVGTAGVGIDLLPAGLDAWYGLRFFTGSTGTLAHCTLEGATRAIDLPGDCDVSLTSVTIRDGDTGIHASEGNLTLTTCRVIDNAIYGIDIDDAVVTFGADASAWNDIYGNGDGNPGRQLRNGPADVLARYVYWGTLQVAAIEQGLDHEPDDPDLGLVTFVPFVDADHVPVATSVDDPGAPDGAVPAATAVFENYPNPFNPSTIIRFDLATAAVVRLEVLDVTGSRVAVLVDGPVDPGRHQIRWQGTDGAGRAVASGVYFYRFRAGEVDEVRRMALLR